MTLYNIIDFETLSTKQTSVALSLGVLVFDDEETYTWESLKNKGLYLKFDYKEQIKLGRHVSKDTLEWWKKQGENASNVLKPSNKDVSIFDLDKYLSEYFESVGFNPSKGITYTRGSFDHPILQDLYEENIKKTCPIPWWKARDTRTLIDTLVMGTSGKVEGWSPHPETVLHNALDDCKNDLLQIQEAYRIAYS